MNGRVPGPHWGRGCAGMKVRHRHAPLLGRSLLGLARVTQLLLSARGTMGLRICKRICCPCSTCQGTERDYWARGPSSKLCQGQPGHLPPSLPHTGEKGQGAQRKEATHKGTTGAVLAWRPHTATDGHKGACRGQGLDNLGFHPPDKTNNGIRMETSTEPHIIQLPLNPSPEEPRAPVRISPNMAAPSLSRANKVSMYNYTIGSAGGDVEVQRGDRLEVIDTNRDWAFVQWMNERGLTQTGYIPNSFLADTGSLEAEDWYFGCIKKMDAKRYLLQEPNSSGSFLVWNNEDSACYYLSVRVDEKVRHYRISQSKGAFYLVERAEFQTLQSLVEYYQQQSDGLCTRLDKPCLRLDEPSIPSLSHTTVDQLEISPNSIERIKQLGRGSFGLVWLGKWNGTTKVAVKELQVTAQSLQQSLYGEADTMWKLSHERLLKLYAVCLQTNPVFIVTEYMEKGTLKRYLRAHQHNRDLELQQLMDFAVQICQGMDYMEQNLCVHRDLRAENILLSAMLSCKIGDFGLARFMNSSSIAISADAKIPIKWMAPEVFLEEKYSSKLDVWSFGVLLVEIITYGKMPFPEKTNEQYVRELMGGGTLQPPSDSPENVSYIMNMCWRRESPTRPSFAELERLIMDLLTFSEDVVE
ncbi:tyrosine-protein kinase SRK2 [Xenopus laevis]|uniref:Tyrosine-protein kinase n=2 Tax=Xenopus laevis TaxID=8355 RepID=A0A974CXG8_XENLA|nr:tyrosine-protein kinase SRK2 [Xenopus laevis]OCT81638.1 hypothetical protein XELAEV_18028461mg [Xenopus laevis]